MATRTVYLVDRAGLLTGTTLADESPLQPGTWLLPAGAVLVPPPEQIPQGRWPRWNGVIWDLITAPARLSRM